MTHREWVSAMVNEFEERIGSLEVRMRTVEERWVGLGATDKSRKAPCNNGRHFIVPTDNGTFGCANCGQEFERL